MTLTKEEIAHRLTRYLQDEGILLQPAEVKPFVDLLFEEVRTALERDESVKIANFGSFTTRKKPERPGRNPKTGEAIPITARRVVTFRIGQTFKKELQKKLEE